LIVQRSLSSKSFAMTDMFKDHQSGLDSPATRLAEVTPNDTAVLTFVSRAIVVETAGHVSVTMVSGDTGRIFIAAGVPFPVRVARIMATGTTATGIVALA
jgi:hypothetical protein